MTQTTTTTHDHNGKATAPAASAILTTPEALVILSAADEIEQEGRSILALAMLRAEEADREHSRCLATALVIVKDLARCAEERRAAFCRDVAKLRPVTAAAPLDARKVPVAAVGAVPYSPVAAPVEPKTETSRWAEEGGHEPQAEGEAPARESSPTPGGGSRYTFTPASVSPEPDEEDAPEEPPTHDLGGEGKAGDPFDPTALAMTDAEVAAFHAARKPRVMHCPRCLSVTTFPPGDQKPHKCFAGNCGAELAEGGQPPLPAVEEKPAKRTRKKEPKS